MIKEQNSSDRLVRLFVLFGEVALIVFVMIGIYFLYWREVGNFPPHFKRLLILMGLCYGIVTIISLSISISQKIYNILNLLYNFCYNSLQMI